MTSSPLTLDILKTSDDERYEQIGIEYQCRLIEILDAALKKNGVPEAQRKAICGDFTFESAMLLDQGEIRVDGTEYQPIIGFLDGDTLYVTSEYFEYHECAFGTVGEFYKKEDT